jgi:hypothetical protein
MNQDKFRAACRVVGEGCYGARGRWAYDAFEFINGHYFGGRLPYPLLVWALTAHGKCLGFTAGCPHVGRAPVIVLHPSLLGGTEKADPWGIDPDWLGAAFALDVLLHELMHVNVNYHLGGSTGPTSHNCPEWVAEVNRLAPLLGFRGVRAAMSKTVRVADPCLPVGPRGKPGTRVVRRSEGNVGFGAVCSFPHGLRAERGQADAYYRQGILPEGAPVLATP